MAKKILITGATGNVGLAVIRCLHELNQDLNIVAAVKDVDTDKGKFLHYNIEFAQFDFTDSATYEPALRNCDLLFLLRPPQISQADKYFKPFITLAKQSGVRHIVFLSVQGVEKSRLIPHNKIEALVRESKIPFTFLRPAYFMQNFTTTLAADLVIKKTIFLPAGKARFTLIDVRDIGAVTANILIHPEDHLNQSYDLTCNEKWSFQEMAEMLSDGLGIQIQYKSPGLVQFFLLKRKEKFPVSFIFVMIALHYLPRFGKEPSITDWVKKITGMQPISFEQFIADNKLLLVKNTGETNNTLSKDWSG